MMALLAKLIKSNHTTAPEAPQRPIRIGDAVILHDDIYNTHVAGILVKGDPASRAKTIQLPNGRYYRNEGYLTHDPNA